MTEKGPDLDRRNVLKTAAGIAGGAGMLTGITGSVAAETTVSVCILSTEEYDESYDEIKWLDIQDACSTVFNFSNIEFDVKRRYKTVTEDVESPSLYSRAHAYDTWLDQNYFLYDTYDAFLVLDYVPNAYSPGYTSGIGTVGENTNKTAVIDAWHDDQSMYDPPSDTSGLEGVACHELGHIFGGEHTDASFVGSIASIMFVDHDEQEPTCNTSGDPDDVEDRQLYLSPCNRTTIRETVSDNLS